MTIGSFLEKNKINDYILKHHMLNKGDGVVLGLSGGPDSVCLFFVLLELRKMYDLQLICVHINHMIRGQEADEDELFVKKLCEKYDVPFTSAKYDIPAMAKENGRGLEEEARMARYACFEELAQVLEEEGVPNVRIAIAHNANDNAETVLFNMTRGTGLDGICGIAPVRGRIIRPLLKVKKSQILDFLQENGVGYCKDATNDDRDYTRNKIRHDIVPKLCQVNDKAVEHIFDMTERLIEVQSFMEMEASGLLCMAQEDDGALRKRTLQTAPAVLRNQAIKSYLSRFMPDEKDVSASHVEAVVSLLASEGEKNVDLPHKKKVVISYDKLFVADQNEEYIQSTGSFEFKEFSYSKGLSYPVDTYTKWFDCDKINGNMEIRTRREGDYLTINNSGGTKLIKDYFIDQKIPKHQRDSVPLLCDGSHVMWVVGYRISEYYKVTESTSRIVEVKYMEEEV